MEIDRNRRESLLQYWGVLWIIMFSGSLYFQILRIKQTMIIVGITTLIFFVKYKRIKEENFILIFLFSILVLVNSYINLRNGFDINEHILLITKLLFICVIASCMSFEDYTRKYVIIMTLEALVSIICYLYVDVLEIGSLPLQHYVRIAANGYYMTPYYTVGWEISPLLHRNSGIFSEPGAHQIFLNFALLFLLNSQNQLGLSKKEYKISIILLVIAIFTTQSTTGYMCLALILVTNLFKKSNKKIKTSNRELILSRFIALAMLIILIVVENNTHIIEYKLSGGGSYLTRVNETSIGYQLSLLNPIIGQGIFQAKVILNEYGILYMSNGLASFLIGSGLVLGITYLVYVFFRMKMLMNQGIIYSLLTFGFYLMCVNASSGVLNPIYLVFLFKWMDEKCRYTFGIKV